MYINPFAHPCGGDGGAGSVAHHPSEEEIVSGSRQQVTAKGWRQDCSLVRPFVWLYQKVEPVIIMFSSVRNRNAQLGEFVAPLNPRNVSSADIASSPHCVSLNLDWRWC